MAIMGLRMQITAQSITQTDFVYGLGNIGLVTHLEVWIGIIVACLPTLTPLFFRVLKPLLSKISKRNTAERHLKESKHIIGSSDWKRLKRHQNFTYV